MFILRKNAVRVNLKMRVTVSLKADKIGTASYLQNLLLMTKRRILNLHFVKKFDNLLEFALKFVIKIQQIV